MTNYNRNLDGNDLLNEAYAIICTGNPDARELDGGAWVPSEALDDYDLETAAAEAATDAGDTTRALLEMCIEYLGEDPIWQELEEAAGRALRAFAEEMDQEARHYLEDEDSEE